MFALIGDVVGSRMLADRAAAQQRLGLVLADVEALLPGVQPLEATVGDEFQGAWERRGQALHAAFLLRLSLLPRVETRYGLGRGEVTALEQDGTVQDGPGWWNAREAISAARAQGVHPGYALGRDYEGMDDALLVAVTERRTTADIDRLAQVLS